MLLREFLLFDVDISPIANLSISVYPREEVDNVRANVTASVASIPANLDNLSNSVVNTRKGGLENLFLSRSLLLIEELLEVVSSQLDVRDEDRFNSSSSKSTSSVSTYDFRSDDFRDGVESWLLVSF
jgi:hypothetical protein